MNPDERLGFKQSMFPFYLNGHRIQLLTNDAHVEEDRLFFHFFLYCSKCGEEKTVRGKLPPEFSETERIQTAKLIALGHFY